MAQVLTSDNPLRKNIVAMDINIETYLEQLQRENPALDPQKVFNRGKIQEGIGAVPNIESTYYNLIFWFLIICGIIAVLSLIYGGILYITSAGEAEKAERGKKTITGAIIGIIIIMLSYSGYHYILGKIV